MDLETFSNVEVTNGTAAKPDFRLIDSLVITYKYMDHVANLNLEYKLRLFG